MAKFLKYGRVVILLQGRFAGKKAVIVKSSEDGTKDRKFGHVLVAGVERSPKKVTKRMGSKKIQKRTSVKPFIKYVNLNHIMPTRYSVKELCDFKELVKEDKIKNNAKSEVRDTLKKVFVEKYRTINPEEKSASHTKFFFSKLRF
ncbi:60S ribosomal protein L27 (macronuclear) [Tetrahymena thermophila SB210]|uniref:Large ribosomal subunit protein eL27 n=2 Tax=Tetrahymena thermophila TaxID=5911 RepID=RL27_TETTH|nr:60S ribosomal protein L27 [Tetrahymena thermophila SB210]P0DJ19.1 RecName: Full=Large ribosomal subunit protein eL27; AltName: Full=60S ribosomal protein L27 [Tetrahymena thermophila]4V8P_AN Chain AN, RPL27 [Tetrahymena thermophila]4V8P_DN Chain DN, RPL27 [Tetrahymena thermophila]4V8P_FN Chain FN, RPL27 [Tetrahymena thermophila]4V8P_HN Chain HN, RPL27 [Tetrahymena thermophila]EAS06007.2 60S ribosomal protein L27 [Tetrahymena thermophila SB210]|eukprot:XP_001026252.2 60S ribosomal protein L27 [Tetrahymena thermophila SB210]